MKNRYGAGLAAAAAAAALGAAAWHWAAGRRRQAVERMRREAKRLLAVRRDELEALRSAAEAGELAPDALGPVPLDGAELESVRLEGNAAVLVLRGERAAAWISSAPLDRLEVPCAPWRGKAFPGRLYTEYLGSGWYAGYACLGRR